MFKASVQVMKRLFGTKSVDEVMKRAQSLDTEAKVTLLDTSRGQSNDPAPSMLEAEDPDGVLRKAPSELKDALVIRYLRNRELFMLTIPDGIEGIDPDPTAIRGAIVISPQDEAVQIG